MYQRGLGDGSKRRRWVPARRMDVERVRQAVPSQLHGGQHSSSTGLRGCQSLQPPLLGESGWPQMGQAMSVGAGW